MKRLRLWMLMLAMLPLLTCMAGSYYFRTVNVKDGMTDNFVRSIERDSYGYIWVATINGLSRYDGHRFRSYMPQEAGCRLNDVRVVKETADSTLWMMCGSELLTYDRAEDSWQKNGVDKLAALGMEKRWVLAGASEQVRAGEQSAGAGTRLLYVDDARNLWVVTDEGLFYYDFAQHKALQIANHSGSPIIHVAVRGGMAVVVTENNRIYEVARQERRLVPIDHAPIATQNRDSRVYIDHHQNLWIYDSHSLAETGWLFSLKTRQWRQLKELAQMENAMMTTITENADGRLWIGTVNAGLHVFEYRGQTLSRVDAMDVFATHSSHVTCLYLDDNNTMWVGSAKLGIAFTDMNSPSFNLVSTGDYEDVSALMEDGKGNLWMGFDGNGIVMKAPSGAMTHYTAVRGQMPSDIVTSLIIRADGKLLAGTYGSGIVAFDGHRFTSIYTDCQQLKFVKTMLTDSHDNLWVATVDKGVVRIAPDGKIVNYTAENSMLKSNGILSLAYDAMHDVVYVGTSAGIYAIDGGKAQFVKHDALEKLADAYVSSLLLCPRNQLWIGSRNGLWVYHPQDGTVSQLTTEQGMSHNAVRALTMSGDRVWASTDNGLTCISVQADDQGKMVYKCYPFLDEDGLQGVVFSNNAALTTADGTVLLGSFRGYVSIHPSNVMAYYPRPHVRFTDFRINGSVSPGKLSDFTIDYGERPTIYVSAMVPALVRKVRYLYRFKGEKDWVRAPGNSLYFVGLTPGTHVLQVKAELPGLMEEETAAEGKHRCQIAELKIKVKAPLWLSTPAIVLYVVLLLGILSLVNRSVRLRHKRELAIKQLEMNLEKYEMEEEKIRFFTNIGHDLKTPLTLVIAPLEKIRQSNMPASIRTELDVAWRNARQLYDLILQLLDFRRLDVGKEKLHLKHGDLVGFMRQTVEGFVYYATRKQISLQMNLPEAPVMVNFDEDKMRRVVTNLLSNAYKYNTDNGSVTVTMNIREEDREKVMVLSVADTGIGIHDKRHVFDRFMQETHGQEQEGSGIGLHIVRQYVELMGGSISVADGKPCGTVFTVTLPMNDEASADIEKLEDTDVDTVADDIITDTGIQDKPTILVVDDNTDARLFLQRSLDDEYHVLVAANGREALNVLAKNSAVSIVVSDVMMPEMDGIEFFRKMKGDINYSHIPVILLTAKSSEENIVEGLEEGVADYITKPFSLAVLRLRIRKVLEWTQNVYGQIANGIEITSSEITVSSLDEELISHVIAIVEEHISDVNYSVAQLSSDVGMTRGHLYKKLMAITGKSPLEFIRIIKLKRGKSLLDQGRTNISEVADMVGLSAKQFSHYFKLTYNDTPSDYLKKEFII